MDKKTVDIVKFWVTYAFLFVLNLSVTHDLAIGLDDHMWHYILLVDGTCKLLRFSQPPHLGQLPMNSLVHRVTPLILHRIEITHLFQLTHKRKLPWALNLAQKNLSHFISRWLNIHLASLLSTWTSHHTQSTNQLAYML